jgi:hypothetical protein
MKNKNYYRKLFKKEHDSLIGKGDNIQNVMTEDCFVRVIKKLTLTHDAPSNCVETDNFRVYLPKDDENVVIIEDYFQEKKTIDIVDFNNLMSVLFSVQDY